MDYVVIYRYVNTINNKCYVGQTSNPKKRREQHKSAALTELKKSAFYDAVREFGLEKFRYEVLEIVDIDKRNDREKYWIQYYDSYNKGYNQTVGGIGMDGFKHSEATRKFISEIQKGKPSPNKGKHFRHRTQEEKDRLSKKVLQYTLDGEFVNEWDSTAECGRNGFNQAHVASCCRGERKTHKGFTFKYK